MTIAPPLTTLSVLLAVFLTACSSDKPTPTEPDVLIWRSCATGSTLQCADLIVPKAYNDESAGDMSIGLNRIPATTQPAMGSLLFNPGGPGGSGTELLEIFAEIETIPDAVLERYDLVGFDPRGIGRSTPVNCDEFGIDDRAGYLQDRTAINEFVDSATDAAQKCYDKYGTYLQQLGSLNVVRDMESIRKALKDEKLNFIGYSYGTRLAGLYLQTYPNTSGAIVLDGSVKPASEVFSLVEEELPAMQRNLEALLAQCTRVTAECSVDDLLQRLKNKVRELAQQDESDEFDVLGSLVIEGTQEPEFGDFLVAPLVAYLQNDDFNVLLEFVQFVESQSDDLDDDDDSTTGQIAVLCADDATRPTADSLEATLQQLNTQSDLFAEAYLPLAASCVGWPEALEPLPLITTNTAPQSLVIGGTSDAQTPIQWSEEMSTSIGGYYLVSSHRGHTSVFNDESDCVDSAVVAFLLDGQLPVSADCLSSTE